MALPAVQKCLRVSVVGAFLGAGGESRVAPVGLVSPRSLALVSLALVGVPEATRCPVRVAETLPLVRGPIANFTCQSLGW